MDDWKGGNDANSVAVASGDVKFRMALTQPSRLQINVDETLKYYMTGISNMGDAKADYDGAGNTANILKVMSNTKYAAGYCNAFVFPDSKTKGYLPSLGQLNIAYQNKAVVDAALAACGGTAISTSGSYWSSTFWGVRDDGESCIWELDWDDGNIFSEKTWINWRFVRPFADLT